MGFAVAAPQQNHKEPPRCRFRFCIMAYIQRELETQVRLAAAVPNRTVLASQGDSTIWRGDQLEPGKITPHITRIVGDQAPSE
jgi:hypothetical protein